jgi:hypothetical protein
MTTDDLKHARRAALGMSLTDLVSELYQAGALPGWRPARILEVVEAYEDGGEPPLEIVRFIRGRLDAAPPSSGLKSPRTPHIEALGYSS